MKNNILTNSVNISRMNKSVKYITLLIICFAVSLNSWGDCTLYGGVDGNTVIAVISDETVLSGYSGDHNSPVTGWTQTNMWTTTKYVYSTTNPSKNNSYIKKSDGQTPGGVTALYAVYQPDCENYTAYSGSPYVCYHLDLEPTSGSSYASASKYCLITAGTSITITAYPEAGKNVTEWLVENDNTSDLITPTATTATTFTFVMPASNVTAMVDFECPSLTKPVMNAASGVTSTEAVLSWAAVAGATKYTLTVYDDELEDAREYTNLTSTSKSLTGLHPALHYTAYVTAYNDCDNNSKSDDIEFTTLPQYNINLMKNHTDDASSDGLAAVEPNGTTLIIAGHPSRTDYTLQGYYADAACTQKIATAEGDLLPSVTVNTTSWTNSSSEWVKGSGADFYAKWRPNVITYATSAAKAWCADNSEINYYVPDGGYVLEHTDVADNGAAPAYTAVYSCTNKTFFGWSNTRIDALQQNAPALTVLDGTAGHEVEQDTTLYAVYAARNGAVERNFSYDFNLYTTSIDYNRRKLYDDWEVWYGTASELMDVTDRMGSKAILLQKNDGVNSTMTTTKKIKAFTGLSCYIATTDNSVHFVIEYSADSISWTELQADTKHDGFRTKQLYDKSVAGAPVDAYVRFSLFTAAGSGASYRAYIDDVVLRSHPHEWVLTDYSTTCALTADPVAVVWNNDGGSIETGTEPASPAAGTNLTLPVLEKTGYTFLGWKATIGGNLIDDLYEGGEQYLVNHDLTLTAQWTGIQPELSATDIYVTSAKDVLTLSSMSITAESPHHTSGTLTIADAVGSEGGTFSAYIVGATPTMDGLNAVILIKYTPARANVTETATMTATINGVSVDFTVHGRSLPSDFVIVAKVGATWTALPADQTTSGLLAGYTLTLDDALNPTEATTAPAAALYKYYAHSAKPAEYIRLAGSENSKALWSSISNGIKVNAAIGGGYATGNDYEWKLATNDNVTYTLWSQAANDGKGRYLGVNAESKWGMHASATSTSLRFLPVAATAAFVDMTVTNWGTTSFDFTSASVPDAGDYDAINVVGGSTNFAATLTGTYTLNIAGIDFDDYSCSSLVVQWKNGGSVVAQGAVAVPVFIDEDNTNFYGIDPEILPTTDVYIRNRATLTITTTGIRIFNLIIESGATLNVATNAGVGITFATNSIYMRGGWNKAQSRFDMPRIYIDPKSTLTKSQNIVNLDLSIYSAKEGNHYYPLAVPFPVAVTGIDYVDPVLKDASVYGKHYVVKTYDGALRAANGADKEHNWVPVAEDATLQPGRGYIITAVAVAGKAIIRLPMSFTNAWTALGEQTTVSETTKNIVPLVAHTGAAAAAQRRHAGWNYLGVPYLSCFGASEDMYAGEGAASLINGELVLTPTSYEHNSIDIPYVSVPTHNFAEYFQTDITDTELRPYWGFFVQVATSGNLTFLSAQRQADENAPLYIARRAEDQTVRIKAAVELRNAAGAKDKTTIIFSDGYTPEYEIGADLEKMFGSAYSLSLYSLTGNTRLAFNAKQNDEETIPLGYRAPEEGTYTFSLPQNTKQYNYSVFDHLYLIDYETGEMTDLLQSEYTFTTVRTQNDTRFALAPVLRKGSPTSTENAETDNSVSKVVINGILYIIKDGRMYDATGAAVKQK